MRSVYEGVKGEVVGKLRVFQEGSYACLRREVCVRLRKGRRGIYACMIETCVVQLVAYGGRVCME